MAENNAFHKRLAASKKMYKAAQKKVKENRGKSGAPEFDDGKYLAKLVAADLGEFGGKLKVLFKWKFEDGQYDGQTIHDYQGIESEDNLFYFGRRIEDLGWEMPDDPTEIPDLLKEIVEAKKMAKIRLRTKGDYQNVYIDKVYGDDDDPDEDAEEADDDEDETPAPKKGKGKKAPEPEEDEEEEDEEADEDEEEEEDEEPEPPKKKSKKAAEPEPPAKKKKAAEPEPEEDEDEEEDEEDEADEDETEDGDVELQVGMTVQCDTAKGKKRGKVTEILGAENKVRVTLDDGSKIRIAMDKIAFDEAPEDDEEEDEEEDTPPPAKKKTKKR